MRIDVTTTRDVTAAVDHATTARVVRETLKAEGFRIKDPWEVSVLFVTTTDMKNLNRKWRKINRATDVLSFPAGKGKGGEYAGFLLGDIVVCPEVVATHAKRYRTGTRHETISVIVHGVLHLLGYDHDTNTSRRAMRRREKEIMVRLTKKSKA